ncbi:MAG: pyridoxal phosphate-dependent aminotransferase [Phycisphaerales bacterium]|nr:pyridoxal phosphate-dependent aminotransferase [Phycisphaerales bacterium]
MTTKSAMFRPPVLGGVIRVMMEAARRGFQPTDETWANLGQGQPEIGELPGAPPRPANIPIAPGDFAYGPVAGLSELRTAVAAHYNRLFRADRPSQYTADNVIISAGGRSVLTRAIAALQQTRLGFLSPDYIAFGDLTSAFRDVSPMLIGRTRSTNFSLTADGLGDAVRRHALGGVIFSNPCNPTGRCLIGDELAAWCETARSLGCTLLVDEFYSHYIWRPVGSRGDGGPVSAAEFVDDVDRDPVLIVDGITKNFRCPGLRLGWAIGPTDVIRAMTASGNYTDGGAPVVIQRAALEMLAPERADRESAAIRRMFREKRALVLDRLHDMGIAPVREPEGAFYAFASLAALPPPLNDGWEFARQALDARVIVVPGESFDLASSIDSRLQPDLNDFVRISFGPPVGIVRAGLDRLAALIGDHRR